MVKIIFERSFFFVIITTRRTLLTKQGTTYNTTYKTLLILYTYIFERSYFRKGGGVLYGILSFPQTVTIWLFDFFFFQSRIPTIPRVIGGKMDVLKIFIIECLLLYIYIYCLIFVLTFTETTACRAGVSHKLFVWATFITVTFTSPFSTSRTLVKLVVSTHCKLKLFILTIYTWTTGSTLRAKVFLLKTSIF